MWNVSNLKRQIGIGALLGLGWVLLALNTFRALQSDASAFSRLVGIAIPFALSLALFAGAIGISLYGLQQWTFRIAVWTVLGAISVTIAIALNVVGLEIVRPNFTLALYMVINAAAGGAVLGFLIGLYDAHRERLRDDLSHKSDEARNLSQRLSVLNRVLRHDVRNQAQIIQGYTDRLRADEATPNELADGLQRANGRLTELSDDARELEALLTNKQFTNDVLDLVPIVREAGDGVQSTYDDLLVEYDLPDEQRVTAPPLIDRAVEHALHNVAEHNESAQPRAKVTLTTASRTTAHLTIVDNGPGIPETEPVRNDDEESPLHHSQGVGLWLVSWIVDEAGGDLTIETPASDDVGTVLTMRLPTPRE
ncbi:MAG: sensor histidine kinase [Haloarculaceae archaeon]